MPAIASANNSRLIYANQGNLRNRAFAFSGWWYLRSLAGAGLSRHLWGIGNSSSGFGIYLRVFDTGGQLEFTKSASGLVSGSNSVTVASAIAAHRWYHIIGESDADPTVTGSIRLWVNGVLTSSSAPGSADGQDFTGPLTVLGRHNTTTLQTDGACHKFLCIQDRVFTADERATLFVGRYPTTIATGEVHFRADYDLTLDGIDSSFGVEPVVTNENTVTLVSFPANLPGLAYYRKATTQAYTDTGTTLATDGTSVQQHNDQTGLWGAGTAWHATQGTAANRPGYVEGSRDAICYGGANDAATYDESEQNTAKFLDTPTSNAPVLNSRSCTLAVFGGQVANQYWQQRNSNYDQALYGLGLSVTDCIAFLGTRRGKLIVTGNAFGSVKASTLAIGATPQLFGMTLGASGTKAFVGSNLQSLSGGALAANTGIGLRAGAYAASASYSGAGHFNALEELVYQRELDATDLAALEDYMMTTYPNITRATAKRTVVLCEGSSTMWGVYSSHNRNIVGSLPAELAHDWKVVNFGTQNATYADGWSTDGVGFDARWADTLGNSEYWQETPSNRKLIFVLAIGFNELGSVPNNSTGASVLIGYYNDLAARARALGGAVIGVTLFRNTNTTARDLYNTHVRADADGLLDLKALVDDATLSIATDALHLKASSQALIGAYLQDAVRDGIVYINNRRGGSFRGRNFRSRSLIR